ncbi:unnamed protein product [Leptosia nina]|uniref:mRNA export factor GLE1 n=1 Tax=Leptosia nina TaxID=320188 RepID=A0AAV1JP12_9NEOP
MDSSYGSVEDLSYSSVKDYSNATNSRNPDISISDQLAGFDKLRISALTKAAEISPLVKEATIGPRSPNSKQCHPINKPINKPEEVINLLEDKLGDDLRYFIHIKKYKAKVQELSEELLRNITETMIANHTKAMQANRLNYESKHKSFELRMRKMQIEKLQESDNLSLLEQAKLDEQKYKSISREISQNVNKILEDQKKAFDRLEHVTQNWTNIMICYSDITNIIESDELAKNISTKYMSLINDILNNINIIVNCLKTGENTEKQVQQSDILAANIENIKTKLISDLTIAKQEEDVKKQKEEELKIMELEKKKAEEAELLKEQQKTVKPIERQGPLFYSESNYAYYLGLKNFLTDYENKYKQLLEDSAMKKFKFDCQKAVNTPINALSSVSGIHMKNTLEKLAKLLRGDRVQISDSFISASQHPQGVYYCTALLAKKIVRQGDLLVSCKPEAAFPLAAIAVVLWVEFPDFGKLLEAYFQNYCPYLVPMLLPQKEGQTDKEFYLSRGYTYNDEGMVEKQDKFLKRMSGIFRLQCAIWISKTPSFISAPNPHSLKYGWKWLASFINLRPEPDISATLLLDFMAVCGSEFYKYYGKQFTKILKLISTDYLQILQNIDEGGPKTRLEVFLQNVLESKTIPPPSGLLPRSTW